jgi:hypothetical protein
MKRKAPVVVISEDDDDMVQLLKQTPGPSTRPSPVIRRITLPLSSDDVPLPEYASLLDELKKYRWNLKWQLLYAKKTKEEKTTERKRVLELCSQLAKIAPTEVLKKMFHTNSIKYYTDVFPSKFIKEGENCLCDDGKLGNCQRFIWNCQWAYHSQSKGFCAQRNRCVVGSRVVYGESNQIVIDELAAGWRCSLKSCLKRFNPNNPEDADGHFISNPDSGNTFGKMFE